MFSLYSGLCCVLGNCPERNIGRSTRRTWVPTSPSMSPRTVRMRGCVPKTQGKERYGLLGAEPKSIGDLYPLTSMPPDIYVHCHLCMHAAMSNYLTQCLQWAAEHKNACLVRMHAS